MNRSKGLLRFGSSNAIIGIILLRSMGSDHGPFTRIAIGLVLDYGSTLLAATSEKEP